MSKETLVLEPLPKPEYYAATFKVQRVRDDMIRVDVSFGGYFEFLWFWRIDSEADGIFNIRDPHLGNKITYCLWVYAYLATRNIIATEFSVEGGLMFALEYNGSDWAQSRAVKVYRVDAAA